LEFLISSIYKTGLATLHELFSRFVHRVQQVFLRCLKIVVGFCWNYFKFLTVADLFYFDSVIALYEHVLAACELARYLDEDEALY
jgi:hypothetical protein